MEQSLANATAYSFSFDGNYGNIGDFPVNNATIDSVFVSGTADNIRVYGPGGPGTSFTATKRDNTTRTVPGGTITTVTDAGGAPQASGFYWVSYDFNTASYNAWATNEGYLQAIGRGQMRVGNVGTVDSGGTGGTVGGQGGGRHTSLLG